MSKLIQVRPRVSEKAYAIAQTGTYIFVVPKETNKVEIAKAVAAQFEVEVVSVNTTVQKGKTSHKKLIESDNAYVLKLIMYLIISAQWLRITKGTSWQIPIPYGALIALMFASHEHFKIDRKIEYAIIVMAMFIGFWIPAGLSILL